MSLPTPYPNSIVANGYIVMNPKKTPVSVGVYGECGFLQQQSDVRIRRRHRLRALHHVRNEVSHAQPDDEMLHSMIEMMIPNFSKVPPTRLDEWPTGRGQTPRTRSRASQGSTGISSRALELAHLRSPPSASGKSVWSTRYTTVSGVQQGSHDRKQYANHHCDSGVFYAMITSYLSSMHMRLNVMCSIRYGQFSSIFRYLNDYGVRHFPTRLNVASRRGVTMRFRMRNQCAETCPPSMFMD